MNTDRLDNELRKKLGDARVEPPSDMWERIAASLQEQGLTAPPAEIPTVSIRRPRKLRFGYAAAAAILVCALVFSLRISGPADDTIARAGDEQTEILTPEQISALIDNAGTDGEHTAKPTVQERVREAARRSLGVEQQADDDGTALVAHVAGSSGRGEVVNGAGREAAVSEAATSGGEIAAVDNGGEAAATEKASGSESEAASTVKTAGVKSEAAATEKASGSESEVASTVKTSGAEGPETVQARRNTNVRNTSDEGRVPVDRPIVIAEDRNARRRVAPFGFSLYSNNVGGLSKEKVVTNSSSPRASDFTIFESSSSGSVMATMRAQERPYKLKHKMPLSGGLSLGVGFGKRWSAETGVTYTYMFSEGESNSSGGGSYDISQKLHYVGIPLGISYDIIRSRPLDLYASAAAQFEMCVSGTRTKTMREGGKSGKPDTEKLNIKGIQPSLGVHLGAEVKLTKALGLYIEPGLNYYFENDKQPESYRTEHPLNFSLRAGLRVSLR